MLLPHFPDDCLEGKLASPAQREKRLNEIETWLGYFSELSAKHLGSSVRYIDDAAERINTCYWESLEDKVRPRIQPHRDAGGAKVFVDRHKISSLLELSIAYLQPIESINDLDTDVDEWNAKLAYYVALNIIGNWDAGKVSTLYVSESFDREHQTWLRYLHKTRDFPIFSNAATWYLFEQYCLLKSTAVAP